MHQIGDCGDRGQQDKDVSVFFELSRQVTFGPAMPKTVSDGFRECSARTNVRAIDLTKANREQWNDNKGQHDRPHDSNHADHVPPFGITLSGDGIDFEG